MKENETDRPKQSNVPHWIRAEDVETYWGEIDKLVDEKSGVSDNILKKLREQVNADTKDESYETLTTMAIIPPLYTDHVNGEILLTTYQDYKIYFPDSEAGRGAKCDEVAEDLKKSQDENVYSEDMSFEVVDHFTPAGRAVYEKLLRELHARANKTNLLEKIS